MVLMLVANTISATILLILWVMLLRWLVPVPYFRPFSLLLEFRPWLDAARVAFLLVVHIGKDETNLPGQSFYWLTHSKGTASAFAYWSPNFRCVTRCKRFKMTISDTFTQVPFDFQKHPIKKVYVDWLLYIFSSLAGSFLHYVSLVVWNSASHAITY